MEDETAVVICGGGPTGVLLSALLGAMGVPNVVLEKERDITTDPRGIALDEDGIRALQSIGIYDRIYSEIGTCMDVFNFVTGSESNLYKKPLIQMDYSTTEGGTGHVGFICHKQPAMEKAMRDRIQQLPLSQIRTEATVTGITETADKVYVEYTDAAGETRTLAGRFLVGADGKTGYVRKRYLEPKGVLLQRCKETDYEETWVALNWQITLPTEKTHPDFPLWRLGYTPEEVYDAFFPKEFRFLCNPKRPSVCGRFGLRLDRLWRFEFVVLEGEDGQRMASPEETAKIIYPYITHPGRRYGLEQPVRFPEDCIKTLRSRPFSFVARSCNKWSLGRVILAGDAAHVFPPFGGQGIASGFRDALALAWRLALLHRHRSVDHEQLLTAWYMERKQQLERSLAATIRNGEYVTEADPFKVFVREWYMWAVQLVPAWRREIQKGARADGMTRYRYAPGLAFAAGDGDNDGVSGGSIDVGGLLLPQVYAWELRSAKVHFTDDLIFSADKKGLFQLLVLPDSVQEIDSLTRDLREAIDADVEDDAAPLLLSSEATILVQSTDASLSSSSSFSSHTATIARIATADEFASSPTLCRNRPPPIGYDALRIRKEVRARKYVILRPDRFVFAACDSLDALREAAGRIRGALHMSESGSGNGSL